MSPAYLMALVGYLAVLLLFVHRTLIGGDMGKNRFATAGTTRLYLSDGEDWVEVKDELAYGEQKRLEATAFTRMDAQAEFTFDASRYHLERLALYLIDWSFRDETDRVVKLNRATIGNLDTATADEVNALLDAHIEARLGKRALTNTGAAPNGTVIPEPAGNLVSVASGDGAIPSY